MFVCFRGSFTQVIPGIPRQIGGGESLYILKNIIRRIYIVFLTQYKVQIVPREEIIFLIGKKIRVLKSRSIGIGNINGWSGCII